MMFEIEVNKSKLAPKVFFKRNPNTYLDRGVWWGGGLGHLLTRVKGDPTAWLRVRGVWRGVGWAWVGCTAWQNSLKKIQKI
ncbi:hypothetical protein HanIR_Chr08g0353891 [Helianthus annuus]|nr:hypothetical protein HanIR_Chr08g0353891 [Helianthus annuus]